MHEGIVEEQIESQDFVLGRMIVKAAARSVADPNLRSRTHKPVIAVGVQKFYLFGDAARIGEIIMILPRDITSARERNPTVERCRQPSVGLMKDAHPRIADTVEIRSGPVRRTVVDRDELEVGKGLRKN